MSARVQTENKTEVFLTAGMGSVLIWWCVYSTADFFKLQTFGCVQCSDIIYYLKLTVITWNTKINSVQYTILYTNSIFPLLIIILVRYDV